MKLKFNQWTKPFWIIELIVIFLIILIQFLHTDYTTKIYETIILTCNLLHTSYFILKWSKYD